MQNNNSEAIAYEQIKKAILLKKLLPGQRLTEQWLSENLKMSRTPVRAALKKLEEERLVELIANRGAIVYKPDMQEIKDVFDVRILLESHAAKMAAEHIKTQNLEKLYRLLDEEKKSYREKNFEKFIEVNSEIHLMPALITGNKVLIHQVRSLIHWSNCYIILKDPFYERSEDTAMNIPEHESIVKALESKDGKAAEKAVRVHLNTTLKSLDKPISIFDV